MTNDNTVETYADDAYPNVRVRLVHDTEPSEPYGDALAPTARVWTDRRVSAEWAGEVYQPKNLDAWTFCEAWERLRDWDNVARYLRMFHGATTVHVLSPHHNSDAHHVIFDTPDWREMTGVTDTPADLTGDVHEWQAWLDGDVYGIVTERRVTTHTTVTDAETGDVVREDDGDDWEEYDAVWGFFGREYAEREARDTLKGELTPEGKCANHHDRASVAVFGAVPLCDDCVERWHEQEESKRQA